MVNPQDRGLSFFEAMHEFGHTLLAHAQTARRTCSAQPRPKLGPTRASRSTSREHRARPSRRSRATASATRSSDDGPGSSDPPPPPLGGDSAQEHGHRRPVVAP